ncbi:MAG: Crp/Fnr family transcriptional regulator [Candidatus Wallbacteria bacterium]|nr:Crp/Fnr family transcriptional regulator [Candidatus Wallbacteria bacterium]
MKLSIVEKLVFLRQAPLLRELPSEELLLAARLAREVELPASEVLFREGEPGGTMYVVVSGAVRITTRQTGSECELAVMGPGAILGEMSIFADEVRSATATAAEPVGLLSFDGAGITELVMEHPSIALAFLKQMAARVMQANRFAAGARPPSGREG